jgi:membrane protease YdiL (CAAX protease family)
MSARREDSALAARSLGPDPGGQCLALDSSSIGLRVPGPVPVEAFPVAAGGLALLLVRPWLVSKGVGSAGMAALFVVLAAMSVASSPRPESGSAPSPARPDRGHRPLGLAFVLGIGLLALTLVHSAARPVAPLPFTAGAVALNTLAAVSEEAFFRRFLYGWLIPFGAPIAISMSALSFALVHVPLYGGSVFWVDLGAGLLLGWQRWASNSWAAPAASHAFANLLAVLS